MARKLFEVALGVIVALGLLPAGEAGAGQANITRQRISMAVRNIGIINVNGSPDRLAVSLSAGIRGPGGETVLESIYVQYSTIVSRQERRILTARLEDPGSIPSGCSLRLQAIPSGKKNEGVSAGEIVLTTTPQEVLTDIGSCVTGTGAVDGARLVFTLTGNAPAPQSDESKTATIILSFM